MDENNSVVLILKGMVEKTIDTLLFSRKREQI